MKKFLMDLVSSLLARAFTKTELKRMYFEFTLSDWQEVLREAFKSAPDKL